MGDETADNVAWSYVQAPAAVASLSGLIAFYGDRVEIELDGVDGP